ncbi:putative Pre-mRNA splicing factor [Jimgerdemannia flammicorona]|uniref:RNA helicase n=1 Tax=Jimgerdemannia flammicorona TaxID=994334 RepID=A0A433QWT1_9FUNG|nr:putative Pre-mRNA splicing factor [Jimgerdemannia flammicorona]
MAFWKPGTIAPGSTVDREGEKESAENVATFVRQSLAALSIKEQRQHLPIYKSREQILYLVEKYQTTIVVGQTGCGKTTQVPQYLDEAGWTTDGRVIACTQPRRVAATTVAQRVAEEMGVTLGEDVGYTIRFEDVTSTARTRIKYMTDGMLFRETLVDPLLTRYSVIMIDEAHERSLYTDVLVGVLKKIQRKRPDLRLIISSATLDAEAFLDFFNTNTTGDPAHDTAAIVSLEGRTFPVDIMYAEAPVDDYVERAVQTVFDVHTKDSPGDVLVFMPGRDQIEKVVSEVTERATTLPPKYNALLPLPLYAGLPTAEQTLVFQPPPPRTRKIIVATNIAEASVTIDGVVHVIDAGFVRLRAYNPRTGLESLTTVPVSKAAARQRAGRAGRTRPGKAYRLYTEEAYRRLREQNVPEIQRSNLVTVVLQLKALGIENVARFEFLSGPPAELMVRALEVRQNDEDCLVAGGVWWGDGTLNVCTGFLTFPLGGGGIPRIHKLLYSLGALDDYGRLTMPLGIQLAEFPVDPMLGKILLDSHKFNCGEEMLTIAAMLSVQNPFIHPYSTPVLQVQSEHRKFHALEGDHLTLLNVYTAFVTRGAKSARWCRDRFLDFKALSRAMAIRAQLARYLARFDVPVESSRDSVAIRKCLVGGYFAQAASADEGPEGVWRSVRDGVVLNIHPSSVLFNRRPKWVIFHEVVETTKPFMRDLTVIEPEWLAELAPHFYEFKNVKGTDRKS